VVFPAAKRTTNVAGVTLLVGLSLLMPNRCLLRTLFTRDQDGVRPCLIGSDARRSADSMGVRKAP
jgi:hypothetical protein